MCRCVYVYGIFVYGVCTCVSASVHAMVHVWRSEDNLSVDPLSFYLARDGLSLLFSISDNSGILSLPLLLAAGTLGYALP